MCQRIRLPLVAIFMLLLSSSCYPTPTGSTPETDATVIPMTTPSPTPTLLQLPASARLGAILSGSGATERSLLTYDDLMNGPASGPLDDGAFALPEEAAMPTVVFEGRLRIAADAGSGHEVIRDDMNYASASGRLRLPDLDLRFVQDGSYLIPTEQGLIYSDNLYWNTIIGPGRIWQEQGDHGWARASFPFALVERNQNCTHNGVMTFLFDGSAVSRVAYQITQETCLYFKFDLWGRATASFTPEDIPQADAVKAAFATETAGRLPTRPIEALAVDYPEAQIDLSAFGRGITPEHMTTYGLVLDGVNYVSGCRTRHGYYAYCESLRLPSYSIAKSAFAGIALMRLGQKYGAAVYDLRIQDYLPQATGAAGDWSTVTLANALDMATGNYEEAGFEVDEGGESMAAFLGWAESYNDKLHYALLFPRQSAPGQVWVYHTSDTFLAVQAMNAYLQQQEGSAADIFDLVRDEVYRPLGLSAGALTTLRTDNRPDGAPVGGYGLFLTQDDIAKMALLLNAWSGKAGGSPLLEPGLLAASMQQNPNDRGLDTSGYPVFKYRNGFWAKEWTPAENSQYTCSFWTPFMSGYGGITVVLMPNGSVYYYFSDNNEFAWYTAVGEANKLWPMCP